MTDVLDSISLTIYQDGYGAPRVVTLHDKPVQDAVVAIASDDGRTVGVDDKLPCAPVCGDVHIHIDYPGDDGWSYTVSLDGGYLTLRMVLEGTLYAYLDYYSQAYAKTGWDPSLLDKRNHARDIGGWVPDGFMHCIGTLFLESVRVDGEVITLGIGS